MLSEISLRKKSIVGAPLYIELIESESRLMVTTCWGKGGKWKVLAKGYKLSVIR